MIETARLTKSQRIETSKKPSPPTKTKNRPRMRLKIKLRQKKTLVNKSRAQNRKRLNLSLRAMLTPKRWMRSKSAAAMPMASPENKMKKTVTRPATRRTLMMKSQWRLLRPCRSLQRRFRP